MTASARQHRWHEIHPGRDPGLGVKRDGPPERCAPGGHAPVLGRVHRRRAFDAFNNFVLPPILASLGASNLVIGLLSSTRSLEGALIQPGVGAVSDRIWTPIGRRRPFMLIGIPLSALIFLASGGATNPFALAIGIVLFSIFYNVASDPYAALLADIAPPHQRGVLSGLSTAIRLVSQVGFLVLVAGASTQGIPSRTFAWWRCC